MFSTQLPEGCLIENGTVRHAGGALRTGEPAAPVDTAGENGTDRGSLFQLISKQAGIFGEYYRLLRDGAGRIGSFVGKHFPSVYPQGWPPVRRRTGSPSPPAMFRKPRCPPSVGNKCQPGWLADWKPVVSFPAFFLSHSFFLPFELGNDSVRNLRFSIFVKVRILCCRFCRLVPMIRLAVPRCPFSPPSSHGSMAML